MSLVDRFIAWVVAREQRRRRLPVPVVTFEGKSLFERYEFLRPDEWPDSWWDKHKEECRCSWCPAKKRRPRAAPWWLPLNAFLHHWKMDEGVEEDFHDHPRWSITIVLKGTIIERTPWGNRTLRPGSMVLRTAKAIHGFSPAPDGGDVWTLFIVGRRKQRQNTYVVTPR